MLSIRRLNQHPTALRLAVWLLLFTLAVQGCASVLVQVLGPSHTHRQALTADHEAAHSEATRTLIGDFLAWREARAQRLQTHGLFKTKAMTAPAHSHDGLQRHHHDTADHSVLALDGAAAHGTTAGEGGQQGQQGQSGGLMLPWGPVFEHRAPGVATTATDWSTAVAEHFSSAWAQLPERPPRA